MAQNGRPLPFHLMWPSHPLKICLFPRVEESFCLVSAQIYIEQSLCHLDSRNFSRWSRPLRLRSQDHKWIEILTIYCHPGSGTWEPSRSGRGDSRSSRTKAFSSLPKPSPTHYLHVTSSNHVYSHTWAFMPNFVYEWAWASRERRCRWLCLASRNLSS